LPPPSSSFCQLAGAAATQIVFVARRSKSPRCPFRIGVLRVLSLSQARTPFRSPSSEGWISLSPVRAGQGRPIILARAVGTCRRAWSWAARGLRGGGQHALCEHRATHTSRWRLLGAISVDEPVVPALPPHLPIAGWASLRAQIVRPFRPWLPPTELVPNLTTLMSPATIQLVTQA